MIGHARQYQPMLGRPRTEEMQSLDNSRLGSTQPTYRYVSRKALRYIDIRFNNESKKNTKIYKVMDYLQTHYKELATLAKYSEQ